MEETLTLNETIEGYRNYLISEERRMLTVDKYIRDVMKFITCAKGRSLNRELTVSYKQKLIESNYKTRSINSMLSSLNSFLTYIGRADLRVKSIRVQREIYCFRKKELTKAEYLRLISSCGKTRPVSYNADNMRNGNKNIRAFILHSKSGKEGRCNGIMQE